uniref:Secreted peptide n=1 Tax=Oryza barthii TaxID=65489 RepID=A0A0D3H620_9ORYZ
MAAVAATTTTVMVAATMTTMLTAAAMKTTSDCLHRRRNQLLRPQTSDPPLSSSNAHPTAAAGSGLHGVLVRGSGYRRLHPPTAGVHALSPQPPASSTISFTHERHHHF